jgi:hypothetical protein
MNLQDSIMEIFKSFIEFLCILWFFNEFEWIFHEYNGFLMNLNGFFMNIMDF